jgi:hypothetical protein
MYKNTILIEKSEESLISLWSIECIELRTILIIGLKNPNKFYLFPKLMKRILGESLKLFSHWRWGTKNIKRCTFLLVFSNNTILFKVSSVTPQQLNNTIGRR